MFRIWKLSSWFFFAEQIAVCWSLPECTTLHMWTCSHLVLFVHSQLGGFMVLEWWLCLHCSRTTWPGRAGPNQSGWLCRGEPMRVTWSRSGQSTPDTFIAQKCSHWNRKHGRQPSLFRTGTCVRSDCLIHHFCLSRTRNTIPSGF